MCVFGLWEKWLNPIGPAGLDTIQGIKDFMFYSFLVALTPAFLLTSLILKSGRTIFKTVTIIGVILVIEFPLFLFSSGEGALGVLIINEYILIGLGVSAITGLAIRLILKNSSENVKIVYLLIILIVLFMLLAGRVVSYQHPTAKKCADLSVYGQTYCYEKLALQSQNPLWCYMITVADNIVANCSNKLSGKAVKPKECEQLPVGKSRTTCTMYTTVKSGDAGDCENQTSYGLQGCISNIVHDGWGRGDIVKLNCASLSTEANKLLCYKTALIELGQNHHPCEQILSSPERDLCKYSYAFNSQSRFGQGDTRSKEFMRGVCSELVNVELRNKCLASFK